MPPSLGPGRLLTAHLLVYPETKPTTLIPPRHSSEVSQTLAITSSHLDISLTVVLGFSSHCPSHHLQPSVSAVRGHSWSCHPPTPFRVPSGTWSAVYTDPEAQGLHSSTLASFQHLPVPQEHPAPPPLTLPAPPPLTLPFYSCHL